MVTIIDTPGLLDSQGNQNKYLAEIRTWADILPRIDSLILTV